MKNLFLSISVLTLLTLMVACQPAAVIKNDDPAMKDSSFYYIQDDINDPFLDTIFQGPDEPVTVSKTFYPPPPPVARFKEIEGFRIQIFAGVDSLSALEVRGKAATIAADSIYMLAEKGLIKVQAGDFPYRYQADKARDVYRRSGYPGAWVIQRSILIPVTDSTAVAVASDTTAVPAAMPAASGTKTVSSKGGKYRIQVIATGSEERAREISGMLTTETSYDAFFEQSGNLYKVYVGYFQEETDARKALQAVRDAGYPDAWLVY